MLALLAITVNGREYRHLLDSIRDRLGSNLPARLPLEPVVSDVLEA